MIRNIINILGIVFLVMSNLKGQNTICKGQFSTYNFDIPGSPREQVLILHHLGIQGIIINTNSDITSYLQSPLVQSEEFKIDVLYTEINISNNIDEQKIRNHLDLIANTDIIYSPIIKANENIEDSILTWW